MTKKQLIEALKTFDDNQEIVVPSPEEPARSGVAITHVIRLRNGKIKLSCLINKDREIQPEA